MHGLCVFFVSDLAGLFIVNEVQHVQLYTMIWNYLYNHSNYKDQNGFAIQLYNHCNKWMA